jgi:hypothetical protein
MNQPGIDGAKAASIEVKGRKVGLKIDVKPLAPCSLGMLRSEADDMRSYALPLVSAVRLCIDEKRVVSAVTYDVHEAN